MMTRTVCRKTQTQLPIVLFFLGGMLLASAGPSHSTDQPPAPQTEPPRENPDVRPKAPDLPPSTIDPGIVKQPETMPRPDAVVVPPVVDPGMAINPEQHGAPSDRSPSQDKPPDSPAPRR